MNYQNTQHRSGLVNLISEFIIHLINEDENTKSYITVTDHTNFLVINGCTNSSKIMDVNELRNRFTKEMGDMTSLYDLSSVNIIDLIQYKKDDLCSEPKTMSFLFYNSELPRYENEVLLKIKDNEQINYSKITSNDWGVQSEFPNQNVFLEPYQSSFPYGYSLNGWKSIFFYLEYVSLNIFPMIKGTSLKFEIDSDLNFTVSSDSIYDKENIESMIKDVFDFDLNKFKSQFDQINLMKDCLVFVDRPWLVKDKVRDSIIF